MPAQPRILGHYKIERTLGKGAMGVVYEGVDLRLHRRVAIKTILKSEHADAIAQDYTARFLREAQAVARLNHPNYVQVYDFGEEDDVSYIVMEFISGKDLKSYFESDDRFEVKEIVRIMGELLDALDFAHGNGVIHRDIKPANVMLDSQRRTKLTDFGVARLTDLERTRVERTQAGTMVGTPAYMSPEQVLGQHIDHRTDIFSAGVVLYQLLTGQKPFEGGAFTVAKKIVETDPPAPSSLVRSISPELDRIVARALAKAPDQRYSRAREFAEAMRRVPERKSSRVEVDEGATVLAAPPRAMESGGRARAAQSRPQSAETDLEFWRSIKDSNDADDFEFYLERFPQGIYADLARRKLAKLKRGPSAFVGDDSGTHTRQIEEEFWRAIKDSGDADDISLYIEKFPQGLYIDLARRKVAKLRRGGPGLSEEDSGVRLRQHDEEFWRSIKDSNDADDFEFYIEKFPQGLYVELAKRRVAKLLSRSAPGDGGNWRIRESENTAALERLRAEADAEERAAERARLEAEERRQAEDQARHEAEERARLEAEEMARREAEAKARREAEVRAKREAEERARREEEEERARREAEAKALREAEAKRQAEELARREAEERARREAEARRQAEEAARREAEARTKREVDERARREAEERARREAEEKARREAEAKRQTVEAARREAEARAKREAEEKAAREAEAKQQAEEAARREAQARAKREAEELARREAEERARREAEEKARREALVKREAEERARRDAEERARREAEEKARREAEAKRQAEEQAKREAEEKSKRDAAEKARREAKEKSRRDAEAKERQEAAARATLAGAIQADPALQERQRKAAQAIAVAHSSARATTAPVEVARSETSGSKGLMIGIGVVALIAIAGGAYYYLQPKPEAAAPGASTPLQALPAQSPPSAPPVEVARPPQAPPKSEEAAVQPPAAEKPTTAPVATPAPEAKDKAVVRKPDDRAKREAEAEAKARRDAEEHQRAEAARREAEDRQRREVADKARRDAEDKARAETVRREAEQQKAAIEAERKAHQAKMDEERRRLREEQERLQTELNRQKQEAEKRAAEAEKEKQKDKPLFVPSTF